MQTSKSLIVFLRAAASSNLRFLLTVSPVPLTATASGQHILTATTYSKSVLRSAAGYLTQTREDTDYFPSYELITAPAFKGQFFEQNMRSVSPEGVAFVMGQFLGAIGGEKKSASPEISVGTKPIVSDSPVRTESGNDICDDIILETWSNKPVDDAEEPPNILLIGDSQMGMIAKALDEQGIRYAGGAIMNASDWHQMNFDLDEEKLFSPRNPEQKIRWESTYDTSFAKRHCYSTKPWLITNVGLHRNEAIAWGFMGKLKRIYGDRIPDNIEIKITDLHNFLISARKVHLGLLCRFLAKDYSVLVVTDPPIATPHFEALFSQTDSFFADFYKSIGCLVFCARDWIGELGGMPQHFRSNEYDEVRQQLDGVHGSPEYYRQLTKEIFSRFSIKPQYRQTACVPNHSASSQANISAPDNGNSTSCD